MSEHSATNPADPYESLRHAMVANQLRARQIHDRRILAAFESVPRHRFVPTDLQEEAYEDRPLPIGQGQTISQPFVVAHMLELAQVEAGSRVLDIGGGSGYQAALLDWLGCEVVSVEIVPQLARLERQRLEALGYRRVTVIEGDCQQVLLDQPPFQTMIAAAAPASVPQALLKHLTPGGRLVMPIGSLEQQLLVIEKRPDGTTHEISHGRVSFVPMTGEN